MNDAIEIMDFDLAARYQILKMAYVNRAPKTGIERIDKYIKALLPESLTVVGAETSVGKTTFVSNIAANVARQDKKVLFFSLESGVSIVKIIACYLTKKKECELTDLDLRQDLKNIKIIAPEQQLSISDIEKISLQEQPNLIILDHIHYLLHSVDNLSSNVANTVRNLQILARGLKAHIIVVSHLKKPESGKENEVPTIYRLKDSSSLYQDPSIVILISRKRKNPEYLNPDEDIFESEGYINIAKNRDFGSTGIARFFFDKDIHTFLF